MNKWFRSRYLYALAAILALAFLLRVVRLDFQPLWWDEGYTVFFATRDFATMLARTAVDIHPPLYYALLQGWMLLAGYSPIALRVFSVLVGVVTIPLIYVVGRQLFNPRVGLVAAFLLAISPLHIYYSQEVRMYGLVTFFALASIALEFSLINSSNHEPNHKGTKTQRGKFSFFVPSCLRGNFPRGVLAWVGYVLATAAALYTQYYAVFILVAEIVVVLYWKSRAPRLVSLRAWITAWLCIFILYLPWLLYAGPKLYTYVTAKVGIEQYARLDPLTFVAQHLIAFSIGHISVLPWIGASALLFTALIVFGILYARRVDPPDSIRYQPSAIRPEYSAGSPSSTLRYEHLRLRSDYLLFSISYLLVPLVLGYLVNLFYTFHPIRYERLLLFAAPAFYLLVAFGIVALYQWRPRASLTATALLVVFCAASLYDFHTVARYPDEDYRPLIQQIQSVAQPNDIVLAPYPWQIGYIESYAHDTPLQLIEVPSDAWITNTAQMERDLTALHAANARAWLLAYQVKGRTLEDEIANFFADDYIVADEWYGNTRLEYFARAAEPALNENALQFAPDMKLVSFGVDTTPILAGADFVPVRLHWQARSNAYSYSLRLVDRAGEKRLQEDRPIPADDVIERRGLFVPRELAPGAFRLRLVVYYSSDGTPLVLADGRTEIDLGQIVVSR